MYAEVRAGDEHWAVDWNPQHYTPEYMAAQLAFEARRAVERAQEGTR